jgi:hypothetical protein
MNTIIYIIISFVSIFIIIYVTSQVLSFFGLSPNKFLDLTIAFRFLYRIFYPIAVVAFVYPKVKYKNLFYYDPLMACYFIFLTLGIFINNITRWNYNRKPQSKPYIFSGSSNLSNQELRGTVLFQIYLFLTPLIGIIIIIFFIKRYF